MADSSREDRFCKRIDFSSGNLATEWKAFKLQFSVYKIAKRYKDMSEEEQISNMLVQMGCDSVPIYSQFVFDLTETPAAGRAKTLENAIKMFDDYFEPVKNVIYERAKFNTMRQGSMTIHQYIVALQHQADQCDYGTVRDELVRDRIVVGVSDRKLREYLIDVDELDLHKCIQKSKQWVSNHEKSSQFDHAGEDNVDGVQVPKPSNSAKVFQPSRDNPCKFCNNISHKWGKCPALHSTCRVCKVKGHWAASPLCKKSKPVSEVHDKGATSDMADSLFLGDAWL